MSSHERAGVVICGAGIAGISAAYFLTRAGVRDILLVDERPPLTLTSDRSTECYRNWWPDPEMRLLMDRSIDLMEELARGSANVFRMNRRGYLYVTADPANVNGLQESAQRVSDSGAGPLRIHTTASHYVGAPPEGFEDQPHGADLLLGAEAIITAYPYITSSAAAALHVRRAGWISAQQMGAHMLEVAREKGVRFLSGRVTGVEIAGGRIAGIVLDGEQHIACERFVNAGGPYFRDLGRLIGLDLPVQAEIHLKVAFEDSLHLISRDAPLLIWSDPQRLPWLDDERRMFEDEAEYAWLLDVFPAGAHTRPEGNRDGASVLMLWDYRTQVIEPTFPVPLDDRYPEIVLRGLSRMLPALKSYVGRAARPRLDGGYYMRTRENRPLIGPTPVEGAFLIGALSGYGIMSACGAADLLAAWMTGGSLPSYAPAFALKRYDDPHYMNQLNQSAPGGEL
ncbi:MAG TPA: FAD-binding oxidoreductase [Anaerolineales bacterium]|nr:FAD-binding oxidoreductase [Anaerolineales bacterium]